MDIAKQARVGMTLTYFDVIELRGEINSLREYIADMERIIIKSKELLEAEMRPWRSTPTANLPDHYLQLRQVLDVLEGGGE